MDVTWLVCVYIIFLKIKRCHGRQNVVAYKLNTSTTMCTQYVVYITIKEGEKPKPFFFLSDFKLNTGRPGMMKFPKLIIWICRFTLA